MEINDLNNGINSNLLDKNGNLHPYKFRNNGKGLIDNYKDIYDIILEKTSFLDEYYDNIDIKQRLGHIRNKDFDVKFCKNECGKVVKFRIYRYFTFCSQSCISSYSNMGNRSSQGKGGVKKLGLCSYETGSKKIDDSLLDIEYRENDGILQIKCDGCGKGYKPTSNNLYRFVTMKKGTFLMCSDECKNENPLGSRNGLIGLMTGKDNSLGKGGGQYVNYNTYHQHFEFCEETKREETTNALLVRCKMCKKGFRPSKMAVMIRMNGLDQGKGYFYCTDECKNTCPLYRQKTYYRDQRPYVTEHINSIHPQLRDMCFERDKYECQICGERKGLRCHHIDPIINNPIESADLDNVITLCNNCHKKSHQLPKCSTGYLSKGCINGY